MQDNQIYDIKKELPVIESGKDEDTLYDKAKRSGTPLIYDGKSDIVDIKDVNDTLTEDINDVYAQEDENDRNSKYLNSTPELVGDFHKAIDFADSHIKPPVLPNEDNNRDVIQRENEIKDLLKDGPPKTGKDYHTVASKIHAETGATFHTRYLRSKYSWVRNHVPQHEPTHYSKEESYLEPHEIKTIYENNLNVGTGRISSSHYSTHGYDKDLFEIHPTDGLRLLRTSNASHQVDAHPIKRQEDAEDVADLHNSLTSHVKSLGIGSSLNFRTAIKDYTSESSVLNKLLGKQHSNSPLNDNEADSKHDHQGTSENLTNGMRSVKPYHSDFTVYSGLSTSSDPSKLVKHTSEGKKLHFAPTFISSSIDVNQAEKFAKMKSDENVPGIDVRDMLELKIPENYRHGIYVDPHTTNSGELEYIINKGHAFKIHPEPKYYASSGSIFRHWKGEIVPQNDDKGNVDLMEHERHILDPNASHETISKALQSHDYNVRAYAAKHPNATSEHIYDGLDENQHGKVRMAAASNPNATVEHLTKAINDPSRFVRIQAASNPNANKEILEKALGESSYLLKAAAKENPNYEKYFGSSDD